MVKESARLLPVPGINQTLIWYGSTQTPEKTIEKTGIIG